MTGALRSRWSQFSIAMAECRRAEEHWTALRSDGVAQVEAALSEKEARHLAHTVFRINALLFLYTRLCGDDHDTRLGVLLGAITYLLDYAYDHLTASTAEAERFAQLVRTDRNQEGDSSLERVLAVLAREAWAAMDDPQLVRVHLDAMLETQRASMTQSNGAPLPPTDLERLTQEKGHRSLCLYFSAVNADFDPSERMALRKFGLYMQYMDDLEDFYEDQLEGRQSPIANPWRGLRRSTRLLAAAWPDLRRHYGSRSRRRFRIFMTWISVYHLGIGFAVVVRELTRRLPGGSPIWLDRFTERLAKRNPFFNVAPVGLTYSTEPRQENGSP